MRTTVSEYPRTTPAVALHLASVAASEANARYEAHWDRCRTRIAGRPCLRCDQLDQDANRAADAERQMRRAQPAARA